MIHTFAFTHTAALSQCSLLLFTCGLLSCEVPSYSHLETTVCKEKNHSSQFAVNLYKGWMMMTFRVWEQNAALTEKWPEAKNCFHKLTAHKLSCSAIWGISFCSLTDKQGPHFLPLCIIQIIHIADYLKFLFRQLVFIFQDAKKVFSRIHCLWMLFIK